MLFLLFITLLILNIQVYKLSQFLITKDEQELDFGGIVNEQQLAQIKTIMEQGKTNG